jgi:hypothetical protein
MITKIVTAVALTGKNQLCVVLTRLTVGEDLHLLSLLDHQHGHLLIVLQLQVVITASMLLPRPLNWQKHFHGHRALDHRWLELVKATVVISDIL